MEMKWEVEMERFWNKKERMLRRDEKIIDFYYKREI